MTVRRTDGGVLTTKELLKNPQSPIGDSPLDKGALRGEIQTWKTKK